MKVVCLLFLFFFFALSPVQAGEIHGRVLNQEDGAVSMARVVVEREDGQFHHEVRTRTGGIYQIQGLGQGIYSITVTAPSGQPSLRREVVLGAPDSSVQLDFRLPQVTEPAVAEEEEGDEGNPNIFVYRMGPERLAKTLDHRPRSRHALDPGVPAGAKLLRLGSLARHCGTLRLSAAAPLHLSGTLLFPAILRTAFSMRVHISMWGPLRPSRSNQFEVSSGGPLASEKLSLLTRFGRLYRSGEVNGNVQVPRNAAERVPQSADPQVNAIVSSLIQAYPTDLPNLPNVTIRQLNTNAPQKVNSTEGLLRLDYKPTDDTSAALRYTITDYAEDPFELVIGKNPQTDLRSQGLHTSLTHSFSPNTLGRVGFHYDRSKALLRPTKRFTELFQSLGLPTVPDVDIRADSFQDLGPGKQFPRFRVRNQFHGFGDLSKTLGRHSLKMGWGTARIQVNDLQSDNSRGTLTFASDFGRSEVSNFLLGRPSRFRSTLGNLYRGFRNWEHFLYIGDRIRLTPALQLSLGLRYELATVPTEVNGLTEMGYSTDTTNFAPRIGIAWNPRGGNTTVRAAYGISYGSVFPVTYQLARFNPPAVQVVVSSAPDLVTALTNPTQFAEQQKRSALNLLSPDLVTPYSHQYTLTVERSLPGALSLRLAYIGMRSFQLFFQNVTNRAQPAADGINTTSNIDARRPDPRFSSITTIESGSNAYYDAAQVSLEKRLSRGLMFRATYTFGKNIDHGGDFTNTASGVENPQEVGNPTSELTSRVDGLKGWSLFDTPHALVISYSYALPFAEGANGWKGLLLRDWEFSGTTVFQSGTRFISTRVRTRRASATSTESGRTVPTFWTRRSWASASTTRTPQPPSSVSIPAAKSARPELLPSCSANILILISRPEGAGILDIIFSARTGPTTGTSLSERHFASGAGGKRFCGFRAAFLNLLNHAQFEKPGVSMASPKFGLLTNTVNKGRVAQLSLQLNF